MRQYWNVVTREEVISSLICSTLTVLPLICLPLTGNRTLIQTLIIKYMLVWQWNGSSHVDNPCDIGPSLIPFSAVKAALGMQMSLSQSASLSVTLIFLSDLLEYFIIKGESAKTKQLSLTPYFFTKWAPIFLYLESFGLLRFQTSQNCPWLSILRHYKQRYRRLRMTGPFHFNATIFCKFKLEKS